ncbi:MAG: hypothetical protein OQJ98_00295 [Candidatus Pacebacteria bacterium]|nr:hypothetical protein [Candidatus Paceibacterota bacterium]
MTKFIRFFSSFGQSEARENDFSEFFSRSAGDKKKVITQVLREANEEQRKVVHAYRKRTTVNS